MQFEYLAAGRRRLHRRPGDARPGQAGRRRRRRRAGRLDAHRHGDGLHRPSSRGSSAAAPCYTTVPAINVVAEKHYAWALPIAAGIATNRDGVPWGYLDSVNDVFKTPQADRDQTMAIAHPAGSATARSRTRPSTRRATTSASRTRTTRSARPRNADGSPRYYDGFTWAFNSTAAPTTYSHTELVYSILDQENIARGHAAYYLKWADEALADGGEAYFDAGMTTSAQLPPDGRAAAHEAIYAAEGGRGDVRDVRLRQRDVRRAARVARGGRLPRPRPRPRARDERAREGHARRPARRRAPPRRSRAASGEPDRQGPHTCLAPAFTPNRLLTRPGLHQPKCGLLSRPCAGRSLRFASGVSTSRASWRSRPHCSSCFRARHARGSR